MNRKIAILAAAFAAFAFVGQSAQAQSRGLAHAINPFDGPINTGGTIAGAAMTATYFGINDWKWKWDSAAAGISQAGAITLTTIGCAALSPMIATALADRPLSYREADGLIVGCVIPIIGPMIVNALYDAHPEWPHAHPVKANYVKGRHHRRYRRHR
ncbi:MAG TPA: hypothetical protein VE224_09095 [Pseudolabrys sp.]|nr:hypothetical protein [Pseudolabrys sp.]